VAGVGDPDSKVVIETQIRSRAPVPVPATIPLISDRIGIDIEPLDLRDRAVRNWPAACIPQEIGAVTRFQRAVDVAIAHPARRVRADACAILPELLEQVPDGALVVIVDAYVHVFFPDDGLRRFRSLVEDFGRRRDLDWVSIDPLVPMGEDARESVHAISVPPGLVARNRREGVFGVISRLSYREGRRDAELLGVAHPGAAWLEWLSP